METIYSITHKRNAGNIAKVTYNLEGQLIKIEFNPDCTISWKELIGEYIPTTPEELQSNAYSGCTIKNISNLDLSFDAFWNEYKYKVGKKVRVKKLWDEMDSATRTLALAGIRVYRKYVNGKRNMDFAYPETYLRNRYWENEYA